MQESENQFFDLVGIQKEVKRVNGQKSDIFYYFIEIFEYYIKFFEVYFEDRFQYYICMIVNREVNKWEWNQNEIRSGYKVNKILQYFRRDYEEFLCIISRYEKKVIDFRENV